jgi:hypothetical protein
VENIWQFMRDNWLSNRVFESYGDILDHCCFAWNKLIDMPWKIISIGTRDWAYRSWSTRLGIRALVAEPNRLENRPFYGRDNRSTGQQKRNVKLRLRFSCDSGLFKFATRSGTNGRSPAHRTAAAKARLGGAAMGTGLGDDFTRESEGGTEIERKVGGWSR